MKSRVASGRLGVAGRQVELPGRGRTYVREAAGPPQAPTLVLLHGLGATAALNWDACTPTLARRFHVLALDHRGHGHGIRTGARFRLEDCADDVAALIRQEDVAPALVAGYSMGGPIAQLLCRRHPELVSGVILCATSRDFRGRPLERARFGVLGLLALVAQAVPVIAPSPLRSRLVHRPGKLISELGGHEPRAILAATASLGAFTSRDWIRDLTTPAVVVVTTRDRVVPVRRQRKLAEALGAPVIELDAGHLAPRNGPLALAEAISEAAVWLAGPGAGVDAGMTKDHGTIEEPENSTVDDWHGQKVADDAELVDELLEETDGDTERAEELFEERSADNDPARDINRPEPK